MNKFCILLFTLFFSSNVNAQCPLPNYSLRDSTCLIKPVAIQNSGNTTYDYEWDFCPGDLKLTPVNGTAIILSQPTDIKIIKEDNNYYGFATSRSFAALTRLEFGNSLSNNPSLVLLNADPLITTGLDGLDMVRDGNKWYAFVVGFSLNKLLRLEFDSLTQASPVVTDLGVSGLSTTYKVSVFGKYVFVSNIGNNTIQRFHFNNGFANPPVEVLPALTTGLATPTGFEVAYDCKINKYIGFAVNYGLSNVTKFDFGPSLDSLPTSNSFISTQVQPIGMELVYDRDSWFLFGSNYGASSLTAVQIADNLDGVPSLQFNETFGGTLSTCFDVELYNATSEWVGFICNNGGGTISRFVYPNPCNNTPAASENYSPSFSRNNLTPGYEYVASYITDSNGITTHALDSVYFYDEALQADFLVNTACVGKGVAFIDNSSSCLNGVALWHWDFGDTNSSTDSLPVHSYLLPGIYNVTLTIFNSSNDSSFITKQITVYENPVAGYLFSNNQCESSLVTFTDSSYTNAGVLNSWSWYFDDGTTSPLQHPSHVFSNSGNFIISLTVTSDVGCSDSISQVLAIQPKPVVSFYAYNTCLNETVTFYNNSSVIDSTTLSYNWDFDYNNNTSALEDPQFQYPALQADYSVVLIASTIYGCSDTTQQYIHIGNQPTPDFVISADTVCAGNIFVLSNLTTVQPGDSILKFVWDFGDNSYDSVSINPVHSYLSPGNYTITLTALSATSCDSAISKSIFVIPSPEVHFNYSGICFGIPTAFNDSSSAPSGSTLSDFHWNFGNNDTLNGANVLFQFDSAGAYPVTLSVTSSKGCIASLTDTIIIEPLPVADFYTGNIICNNSSLQFTDTSSIASGNISSWQWSFGDSTSTSFSQNPSHIYTNPGIYGVSFSVTSDKGCGDDTIRYILVNTSPAGNIVAADKCFGESVSFSFIETNPLPVTNNWLWQFGDATLSNLPNPVHSYSAPAYYTVTLQAFNMNTGCTSVIIDSVKISPIPSASINVNDNCLGDSSLFFDNSSISSGSITNWQWKNGNSTFGTSATASLLYSSAGNYQVTLIVTSDQGCKDTTNTIFTVNPLPTADFTPNVTFGEAPMLVDFTNESIGATNFNWAFGDNGTSAMFEPQHIYNDTGLYTIQLLVTSAAGCKDSTSQLISVLFAHYDIAVTGVNYELAGNVLSVYSNINNFSNLPITDFTIQAAVFGESVTLENWAGNLGVANTVNYKLKTNYILNSPVTLPEFICIEIDNPNGKTDQDLSNNKMCITTKDKYEIFSLSPNPSDGDAYLTLSAKGKDEILVSIYNTLGELLVPDQLYQLNTGLNILKLNTAGSTAGLYFVSLKHGDDTEIYKLVIR